MVWPSRRRLVSSGGELLPAQGGAEDTEERVLALHTEMCESGEIPSVEEGHDVESDIAEETMAAMVKIAKMIKRSRRA